MANYNNNGESREASPKRPKDAKAGHTRLATSRNRAT
jgi:hypothetical protein